MPKKHTLFLFIAFVVFLCNAQLCIADSYGANRRLFQNSGVNSTNTVSGEALIAGQMVLHVNFDVLRGKKRYAPNLLLDIFGKSIQVSNYG